MGSREERHRHSHDLVPLAALISRELKMEKMEKPTMRYGCAAQSRKGEDYFLMKTDCQRVPGNPSTSFSVFGVCNSLQDLLFGLVKHFSFTLVCFCKLQFILMQKSNPHWILESTFPYICSLP